MTLAAPASDTSRFNEAGVVHAGEERTWRGWLWSRFRFNEAGVVHAGEAPISRSCRRPHHPCFNEAGVVHAGEATATSSPSARRVASTRPALFTPERSGLSWMPREILLASTRPALFTPERSRVERSDSHVVLLQRGRRCSRRRGRRGLLVLVPLFCFNEAGVVHAGEAHPPANLAEKPFCFNEAGVVHAGEAKVPKERNPNAPASTRPALFTPERRARCTTKSRPMLLQRGRRCSRRRGGSVQVGQARVVVLQRGRRCSRRRGRRRARGARTLEQLQRGRRCSRRRGSRYLPSQRGLLRFNEAGVVHAGEGRSRRRRRDVRRQLQRGRRCSRRRGQTRRLAQEALVPASTRPALFTPERVLDRG